MRWVLVDGLVYMALRGPRMDVGHKPCARAELAVAPRHKNFPMIIWGATIGSMITSPVLSSRIEYRCWIKYAMEVCRAGATLFTPHEAAGKR